MPGSRGNGEGTIYQRPDGRWSGQAVVQLVGGGSKRITVSGGTRAEVNTRLQERLTRDRNGYRSARRERTVGEYLDYWLKDIVPIRARETTQRLYEAEIRLYIKPGLGKVLLSKLTPRDVQRFVNDVHERTGSPRTTAKVRATLRAALNHAEREELVTRNVARQVTLPTYEAKPISPWSSEQVEIFLNAVRGHRWYGAFLMSCIYGARRGEVLGLPWKNVDFDAGTIRIDQQLQRIGRGLKIGQVKTKAGQRVLPLPDVLRAVLVPMAPLYGDVGDETNLVFRSSRGNTWIDPHNYTRTFHEICAEAGLPRIRLHDLRHTAATLLKNIGVPDRDIQHILGHADITTTLQIYQHGDQELQGRALAALGGIVAKATAEITAEVEDFSTGQVTGIDALTSGRSGGTRTHDTRFWSLSNNTFHNILTPVPCALPNASDGPKLQQIAEKSAEIATTHDAHRRLDLGPDDDCGQIHSTHWLLAELQRRMAAQQVGEDLAA